jgi:LysM repeat protein
MPDYQPNPVVRVIAVIALVAAFVLVVVVIATSGGGSSGGGSGGAQTQTTGQTKEGRQAVAAGVWIVHSGDTLGQISEETGVDVDKLVQLNPDLDPQALLTGQRIALQ